MRNGSSITSASCRCSTASIDESARGPRLRAAAGLLASLLLLAGCGGAAKAPVESNTSRSLGPASVSRHEGAPGRAPAVAPERYRVAAGDTLYSIAFRYGLDYRELARWNAIEPPYVIVPGQLIAMKPVAGKQSMSGRRAAEARTKAAPPARSAAPAAAAAPAPRPADPSAGAVQWRWPAAGSHRQSKGTFGNVGLEIYGERGAPVTAAAAGEVVYAGSGLIGYGKLIIIKHNDLFLSAYAHNDSLLVEEGAMVQAGQTVARMGKSGTKQVVLHFEIRRNGKPVPPLDFLPQRQRS